MDELRLSGVVTALLLAATGALGFGLAMSAASPPSVANAAAPGACQPLAPPSGNVVNVATVGQLTSAVNNAAPGTTILVQDGTYNLDGAYLRFAAPNVTLRSASGNPQSVVLDGNYVTTEILQVVASNVTVAELTLREAYYHPIHVSSSPAGHTLNTQIYRVRVIDGAEQAIKINPAAAGYYADNGTVACSHIELTDAGRPHVRNNCYTGGIDAHQSRGWTVRDNWIGGFWCATGLSEHGIHFWTGSRDTVIERNTLVNNARGIGCGLLESGTGRTYADNPCSTASGYVDHYAAIVRNNFVFVNRAEVFASQFGFDCGICITQTCGAQVVHNTVFSTQAPFSSIEWRFGNTVIDLRNNLVSHNLRDRGGTDTQAANVQNAPASLFVNSASGDLHLASNANTAIDQGATVTAALANDDIDGHTRPAGGGRDIGADEHTGGISIPPYERVAPLPPPATSADAAMPSHLDEEQSPHASSQPDRASRAQPQGPLDVGAPATQDPPVEPLPAIAAPSPEALAYPALPSEGISTDVHVSPTPHIGVTIDDPERPRLAPLRARAAAGGEERGAGPNPIVVSAVVAACIAMVMAIGWVARRWSTRA